MASINFELPAAVHHAFAAFIEDKSLLALSLAFSNDEFQPLPLVHLRDPIVSFQNALNELDNVLNPRVPLYLLLRRDDSLIAITYVPYLAKEEQRAVFLNHRQELVRQLGEKYFSMSLICKEIGEITDARSWEERDKHMHDTCEQADNHEICEAPGTHTGVRDVGYKQNKCRLCDRRMKNKITPEALDALKTLDQPGATVQISVALPTSTLTLTFARPSLPPTTIPSLLPVSTPSFTFYRHPTTHILYFIFHSPDSASVQQRMQHTMAIPGLINVHAEDADVHVEQKIEIHEPGELVFEERDEKVGRFRSVYLRGRFEGTESLYEGLEGDRKFFEGVK